MLLAGLSSHAFVIPYHRVFAMRPREKWLLGPCFFLSGGTSLVFEVAWSKELSYILGNTLFAVSTVVAAFMAGLGAGSAVASRVADRFARPLRAYALLQFCVGIWGILSLPLFRATKPLFGALYQGLDPGQGSFLLARFGVVFLLMFVPTALMGMTLPVIVGAFARNRERYDFEAGILYGVNTLGAVAGTLGAGFILVPALGLFRTCLVAGILDAVAGSISLRLDHEVGAIRDVRLDPARPRARPSEKAGRPERRGKGRRPAQAERAGNAADRPAPAIAELAAPARRHPWTPRQWLVASIFGLSGLVAMIYEVGWFRLLGLAMGPSVYAFSAMLGLFLVGIGIGSAVAARWAGRGKGSGLLALAVLEGVLGFVSLLSLFYLNALPTTNFHLSRWAVQAFGEPGIALERLLLAAITVLPPCLVMGMIFPYAVRAIREAGHAGALPESTVGRLYLFNTAGGIVGSLAAGFWLVPSIGMWNALRWAGVASVLLGCSLAVAAAGRRDGRARVWAAVTALAVALLA